MAQRWRPLLLPTPTLFGRRSLNVVKGRLCAVVASQHVGQESVMSFGWTVVDLPRPLAPHAPPTLNAKCRVCQDMQVARCLCNFPATHLNNKPLFVKCAGSFGGPGDPLLLCVGKGQGSPGGVPPTPPESTGDVLTVKGCWIFVNCSGSDAWVCPVPCGRY